LALRQAGKAAKALRENAAKPNRPQAIENKRNRETADSAPQLIQRLKAPHAKRFASRGEMKLSRLNPKGEPRIEAQRVAQKSALKPLKSLAGVNLCAGRGGEVSQAAISPTTIALASAN
jgi:hypothetical protein